MFFKSDSVLGVNCEHGQLSLTYVKSGVVKKSVAVDVPENIADGAQILSENLFAALLKDTIKENKMNCKDAAYAIPAEDVFIRNITMPKMSAEQIRINIPFEFRDFIQGELKDYIFDYANLPDDNTTNSTTGEAAMNLLAAAISQENLKKITSMFKRAGLRLIKATPEIFTYEALISLLPTEDERNKERCFLDIGQGSTRMLIYKNGRYKLTHMIDIGERKIVQVLADEMNVDMHLAKTYLKTNYENAQELPAIKNTYKDISLEVLKGINFYEVSDMTARLSDVVLCGVGSMIPPLVELLKERIVMNVVTMEEMFHSREVGEMFNITAPSYGLVAKED